MPAPTVTIRSQRNDECLAEYEDARIKAKAIARMLGLKLVGPEPPRAYRCYTLWAYHRGARVGFLDLVYTYDDIAIIQLVYVHPDFRGKGVATKLVEHAIRSAKMRKMRKIRAVVLDEHPLLDVTPEAMRRVLEKLGFRHVGNDVYELELDSE